MSIEGQESREFRSSLSLTPSEQKKSVLEQQVSGQDIVLPPLRRKRAETQGVSQETQLQGPLRKEKPVIRAKQETKAPPWSAKEVAGRVCYAVIGVFAAAVGIALAPITVPAAIVFFATQDRSKRAWEKDALFTKEVKELKKLDKMLESLQNKIGSSVVDILNEELCKIDTEIQKAQSRTQRDLLGKRRAAIEGLRNIVKPLGDTLRMHKAAVDALRMKLKEDWGNWIETQGDALSKKAGRADTINSAAVVCGSPFVLAAGLLSEAFTTKVTPERHWPHE